ncbi:MULTISPECIES: branched-chain amino acid ABC transporter substrate-binding protein [Streptomyces]|uniref:Branched-chain amino acid ABC transporter substrate-binding protein n=1 Tax=Streptomyces fuscus TaxID=3048495 RepID=A0ABT7JB05_9ACTN|nr:MULTISPECIES: branched-chain amino acid ABC transporter substrate-binding protein [Streptomyces]MCM1977292.1 branched-chain amino acid ABC transporter substrate-binding protein [Streptomyces sp. G1]MDL2082060.1 branched-chain amino acid ABC transporter substrate-binding protein [Streptomyces fuscus]WBO82399.1 branched-chain amino acid ABC transporter substrate-binding protein [Streptomyces sp. SBE_14.2]
MVILTSVLATGALSLTACGSRDDNGGGDSDNGKTTTLTIGVDAPLSGENSTTGLGLQYGSQIAVDEANEKKLVPGVTFKLKAYDDKAQPATGQSNATAITGDKTAVGAVGPLNSGVAQTMQQVFASANMVQISPANTAPELTQGKDWQTDKKRPFKTYFRTSTTDELQGSFAADYAFNGLKKKKAFVVDDKQTYGAGLAKIFNEQFKKFGGKVVETDHVNTGDKDFGSLVTKIKNSGADVLYYGGQYDESALLTKQMKDAGVKIPLFGGDGMFATTYIEAGGAATEGDLATAIGVPADTLPAAKTFIETYKSKGYKGDYGAYGTYAYDATTAIIKAVKAVVDANDGKVPSDINDLRSKVVDEVQKSDFEGLTGKVAFDEYGDTTNKQLTVYQVTKGEWKAVKTGTADLG